MYKTTLSGQVWRFDSLKTLMAKASPARSGDALAGIIATSAEERMAAKMALAEVPLTDILDNPLIPYEQDEVTRLILDTHDAQGFAALGADARSEGRLLYLGGSAKLHGATVTAPDLRGGAALVLAGLGVGDGSCVRVLDAGHIRRGYADLAGDLRRLGADCRAGRTGTEAGRQTKKL